MCVSGPAFCHWDTVNSVPHHRSCPAPPTSVFHQATVPHLVISVVRFASRCSRAGATGMQLWCCMDPATKAVLQGQPPPPLSPMFSGTFKRKLRVAKVRSAWPRRVRPTIKACEQGGPNGRLIMRTEDDLSRFFLWRPFFVLTPTTVNLAQSVFSHSSKRNMNDACRPQLVCCFSFQLFCLLEEIGTGVSGSRPRQVSSVQEPRFSYLLLLSFCV